MNVYRYEMKFVLNLSDIFNHCAYSIPFIHAFIFSWIVNHSGKLIEAKYSNLNEVDQWAVKQEGEKVSIINYLERRSS